MENRPSAWPKVVNELLPNTLFRLAAQYPDLTYSEYPHNPINASDGFRKITYREVANAVHAVAWWIEENVGKPKNDDGSETMVYMGPNDLRYGILVLGSVMVGYKVSSSA
jgi:acyl-CoA synthetase (AMP-forming)/AMP-acid ligase II